MVGAGTMAGAHSLALTVAAGPLPGLPVRPRLVAVADVNGRLASSASPDGTDTRASSRTGGASSSRRTSTSSSPACRRSSTARSCWPRRPPASTWYARSRWPVRLRPRWSCSTACRAAGVFHGLGAAYRWSPAVRAIRALIEGGELGDVRSLQASFMLDYAADPEVPLLWRFQRSIAGGGIAIDTGYHLVDCARFLVGEIEAVQALTTTVIAERPLPSADAIGNRGGAGDRARRAPWHRGRRGRRRGARDVRQRGVRRARDEPRRDRPARVAAARRVRLRSVLLRGTSSSPTSSGSACPATPRHSATDVSS